MTILSKTISFLTNGQDEQRERERHGQNYKKDRERLLGLGEEGMWMSGGHTKLIN